VQSNRQEYTHQMTPLRQRKIDDIKFRNMSPESAPGPKPTCKSRRSMSAHRGEADVTRTSLDVR
jgi:hypothetical protein